MSEPIDIELLDPLYRDVFRDPVNGTPDNISKAGCLALAKLGSEAWNAWRRAFPVRDLSRHGIHGFCNTVDFSNTKIDGKYLKTSDFEFGDGANFKAVEVQHHASFFRGAKFGNYACFSDAVFSDFSADFSGAVFQNACDFSGVFFGVQASFRHASFGENAVFTGAVFGDAVDFSYVNFLGQVFFDGAIFEEYPQFYAAQFQGRAWFDGLSWEDLENVNSLNSLKKRVSSAAISRAKLSCKKNSAQPNNFSNAVFSGALFQHVTFNGRTFRGACYFDTHNWESQGFNADTGEDFGREKKCPTTFHYAPSFLDCKLSFDTTFDGAVFPTPIGDDKSVREEQRFFKLEMAEEAARATGTQRFLYKAYALCSDYGFSVVRPLALLALTLLGFASIYGALSWANHCLPSQAACQFNSAWAEFSLIQALPLPGLDKLGEELRKTLFSSSGGVSILVTLAVIFHKTISIAALFLAGLALRNLFKLK